MNNDTLRKLAGLVTEDKAIPAGFNFTLSDEGNMHKALNALLEAGLSVDLNLVMGTYYFNFTNEGAATEARKIAAKVIDKKKETKWSE